MITICVKTLPAGTEKVNAPLKMMSPPLLLAVPSLQVIVTSSMVSLSPCIRLSSEIWYFCHVTVFDCALAGPVAAAAIASTATNVLKTFLLIVVTLS